MANLLPFTLKKYVLVATLARATDAGAATGLVLLVASRPGGTGFIAGIMAACLTAPHLFGPLLARRLDTMKDGRPLLSVCNGLYGLALAAATVCYSHVPLAVCLLLVALAGSCGPILTGGLSSHLNLMMPADIPQERRVQGWDALTYGIAGVAGPGLVGGIAVVAGPSYSLLILSMGAVIAAGLIWTLPVSKHSVHGSDVPDLSLRMTLKMIMVQGGLRRTSLVTAVTALLGGTVAIFTAGISKQFTGTPGNGALLTALFGLGSIVGSAIFTICPLKTNPDESVIWLSAALGAGCLLVGMSFHFGWAAMAILIAGIVQGPFFIATLAARSSYAPNENSAQIFVTMAALKIGAASAGAVVAGIIGLSHWRVGMLAGSLLIMLTTLAMLIDRRWHPAKRLPTPT